MRISHLLSLLATAPACLGPLPVEPPRMTIRSAEVIPGPQPTLRLSAFAYNPNAFPVALRRASIEIDVAGVPIGHSIARVERSLPPRKPVVLDLQQPLVTGGADLRMRSAWFGPRAPYRLRGHLDFGARTRDLQVAFRHEGLVSREPRTGPLAALR